MTEIFKKGFIAKKVGMSRFALESGEMVAVTLVKLEAQKVTKLLSEGRDGYDAYQLGYEVKASKNLSKADLGRLKKEGVEETFSKFSEVRLDGVAEGLEVGQAATLESLKGVDMVNVSGVVKGRGFQGAVKRWGATIGRMSHGSRFHRRPGSLGQCTSPGRVFKNKHQPGRMGNNVRTVKNIKIVDVDHDANVVALKGSLPGANGGYIRITAVN